MLTQEQAENFKKKLIEQIESSFPEDKKQFALSQIEAMDSEELEKFLVKNRLLKKEGTGQSQCVFCSIVFGDINAYKIAENSKAIAVLEINPRSKGHTIIIPKEHISSEKQLPSQMAALSKKVSSLIKLKLKPKAIKTEPSNVMGHEVINIIPIYEEEAAGEQKPASPEELEELQKILTKRFPEKKSREKRKTIGEIVKKFEENIWLPRRIP